jgi:anion-transporting  ArsA/GET3 family ATPase
MLEKLSKSRLIFVTGKGGVGKSIISASLGMAFHNVGHRPLLVEFFPDKRLEHIFKLNAEIYRETEIKKDFNYINISSSEALAEYIRRQLILDTISKFVLNTKFYRYLSSTAPGLKELVAIGKLYDLEKKRDNDGNYLYDPIIVDAPQLGKFIPFIKTPQTIMNMFKIGPVKKEAEKVNSLICSNKSAVVIVSTGDKMAISETIEAKKELFSIKYPVVRLIIINMAISEKISTLDNKYYEQRLNDILTNNNIKDELMPAIEKLINYVTLEKTAINELVTNTDNVPILILPLIKNTDNELLITEELSHYFTA